MRRKRCSEEQIIRVLQEAESGTPVKDVCREHGIANATFYAWKAKYRGLEVNEARCLKELELENRRLKTAVADLAGAPGTLAGPSVLPSCFGRAECDHPGDHALFSRRLESRRGRVNLLST
jgi:putative transposase